MQQSRRPVVAGNWKMNGSMNLVNETKNAISAAALSDVDVVVCAPYPYLSGFSGGCLQFGAQNVSADDNGAHTGEVSTDILEEFGCQYVIVGHSERREEHQESNKIVADKVARCLNSGLVPIFCIGESLDIREKGELFTYLAAQLDAVLDRIGVEAFENLIVAYEPIWAIGTGVTATPEQAQEVHAFIRSYIAQKNESVAASLRILYGGSVKGTNADELFSQHDVDGGLIGGASLNVDEFIVICQMANKQR